MGNKIWNVISFFYRCIRPKNSEPKRQTYTEKKGNTSEVTSRYADIEGVTVNITIIPEDLRNLLPYAKEWAIGDDSERQVYAENVSLERKKEFVDSVMPKMDELDAFHEKHKDDIPIPDEVVLFDMMAEAASELYYEVYPKGKNK